MGLDPHPWAWPPPPLRVDIINGWPLSYGACCSLTIQLVISLCIHISLSIHIPLSYQYLLHSTIHPQFHIPSSTFISTSKLDSKSAFLKQALIYFNCSIETKTHLLSSSNGSSAHYKVRGQQTHRSSKIRKLCFRASALSWCTVSSLKSLSSSICVFSTQICGPISSASFQTPETQNVTIEVARLLVLGNVEFHFRFAKQCVSFVQLCYIWGALYLHSEWIKLVQLLVVSFQLA